MFGYIILALVIFGVFYAVSLYNWFQTTLTRIKASIQEIGNQLKRQADLIPNLESSAKGYLKHEKDIYKDITTARKAVEQAVGSSDMSKISKASDQVSALLPKLQVIVESNPEIKGSEVVVKLMDELRDTSDKLMYSRRVVIDLSADFNQKLVVFPSNIVGNMFGFKLQKGLDTPMSGEHLEVSSGETHSPKISL
ncbi:MAG: LemA family protein [Candidatus Collierbacteria bacterium GW2011_GWC1_45_47]|uniref:LemA family protein n=4 Tax=Candidatus Collieribacteriota TaxID=1752725 RepID=A0A0G1HK27_9BACT|nr:MAG: LemA family protein [Candidatus Collierbacteria bacterium GW2011_GWA1_44_12]KKT38339.1 MAG: LemA family protein [Candidatus Collierbacteria bacterium GW2011_GWF1_44_12]KKT46928.1 MAG: LemA family protein [Candidatus Collierbacteria bacterium GW2011_GWF2_44_15]KKU09154.1 MAG: LemA family protein [Candidatus Collierbacteria bacterium GW2011_GWC1_45_47]KKU29653.1 MAG: LemA family protein [Candidatus Collierbacteria bacterium GW2011_GWE1_46_18]